MEKLKQTREKLKREIDDLTDEIEYRDHEIAKVNKEKEDLEM